jgi:hypothetical protein
LQVAASPGFLSLIKSLQEVTRNFNEVGLELGKPGGALEALGKFLEELSRFVVIVTESSSITIFFNTLTTILKGLNAVLGTGFGQAVLAFTGGALAISAAINLTSKAFGFYGDSLKGAILGTTNFIDVGLRPLGIWSNPAAGAIAKIRQEFVFLTYGLGFVSAPFLTIAAAVAAVVAVFALAYTQSESLRTAVSGLAKIFGDVFNTALKDIQETLKKVFGEGTTLQTIFKGIGDFLSVTLIPILGGVGSALIGTLGGAIQGVIKLVGGILDIFDFVFNGVEALIGVFVGVFTGNWDMALKGLKDGVKSFQSFFGNILGAILAPFRGLINGILGAWNSMSKNFKVTIPKWVPLIGGKVFGFPTVPLIPNLAQGGIVMPSASGTIARIGEAGRPERIEPLDPTGLSKRDRAMIELLAGPAGGINITVNPSAGMDERELANLVSRQLAFQMRKGA